VINILIVICVLCLVVYSLLSVLVLVFDYFDTFSRRGFFLLFLSVSCSTLIRIRSTGSLSLSVSKIQILDLSEYKTGQVI
jgi:hypothetical protein